MTSHEIHGENSFGAGWGSERYNFARMAAATAALEELKKEEARSVFGSTGKNGSCFVSRFLRHSFQVLSLSSS